MAIINIKDGIDYDTEKTFEEQTEAFKEYANNLYYLEVSNVYNTLQNHYPEFDEEGNITYNFEDNKLIYDFKRIQNFPNSSSNRSIKEIRYIITVK
jgi:hypothetical protein